MTSRLPLLLLKLASSLTVAVFRGMPMGLTDDTNTRCVEAYTVKALQLSSMSSAEDVWKLVISRGNTAKNAVTNRHFQR